MNFLLDGGIQGRGYDATAGKDKQTKHLRVAAVACTLYFTRYFNDAGVNI